MQGPAWSFGFFADDKRDVLNYSGTLKDSNFFLGSAATNDSQVFGYNASTKEVLYDANGSWRGGVSVIATLTSSTDIVASDIEIF